MVRIAFKSYLTTSLASNVAVITLTPANLGSASINAIYTGFELFRVVRLHVHMLPRANLSTLACGYNADPVSSSPGGLFDVMALLDSGIIAGASTLVGSTVPVDFTINPQRLKGQLEWYKCTPDASDTSFEAQGALIFYGSGASEAVLTVLSGTVEFRNPVDPTVALSQLKTKLRTELIEEFKSSVAPALPLSWKGSSTVGSQSPDSSGRVRTAL